MRCLRCLISLERGPVRKGYENQINKLLITIKSTPHSSTMCAAKLEAAAQAAAGPKNQALEELFEGEFLPVYGQSST